MTLQGDLEELKLRLAEARAAFDEAYLRWLHPLRNDKTIQGESSRQPLPEGRPGGRTWKGLSGSGDVTQVEPEEE
jgi:hypothetical protein